MFFRKKPKETIKRIENPAIIGMIDPTDGGFTVHLDPKQLQNPGVAGIMLSDIAVHMSKALAAAKLATSEEAALAEIVALFNAEQNHPTDAPVGGLTH